MFIVLGLSLTKPINQTFLGTLWIFFETYFQISGTPEPEGLSETFLRLRGPETPSPRSTEPRILSLYFPDLWRVSRPSCCPLSPEVILSCVGRDDYIFGFFFMLDIGSTATLMLDLTWVAYSYQDRLAHSFADLDTYMGGDE